MGTGNLTDRANSQTVDETFFNTIHSALNESVVPRNSTGSPTAGKSLGTSLYPWGSLYCDEIIANGSLLDISGLTTEQFKVISGAVRSTSNQPAFLDPAGSGGGRSLTIEGTPTALVLEISGTQVTVSADITVSGLTAAPSSNNTATINESTAASQEATRTWGEPQDSHNYITVSSAGSEITALIGKRAAFKVVGDATEYFTAFVESATQLKDCYRGFFYDSSIAPFKRRKFSNGNTITLMKLGWLFLDENATTTEAIYNEPIYAQTQPTAPTNGDYWYDMENNLWKRYNGSIYVTVDRLLIGMFFCDTADCLGVRCVDFYDSYSSVNTVEPLYKSASTVIAATWFSKINVAGNIHRFYVTRPIWDMATDLAGSADMYDATEQASRNYYFYVKDTGALVISDMSPYHRPDLFGWYHPHNPWRCVGFGINDGSSNITSTSVDAYDDILNEKITTNKIKNNSVTPAKMTSHTYGISEGSGTDNITSATFVAVNNLSVTLTTTGKTLIAALIPDPDVASTTYSRFQGTDPELLFQIDGVSFSRVKLGTSSESTFFGFCTPSAGSHTVTCYAKVSGAVTFENICLFVFEL